MNKCKSMQRHMRTNEADPNADECRSKLKQCAGWGGGEGAGAYTASIQSGYGDVNFVTWVGTTCDRMHKLSGHVTATSAVVGAHNHFTQRWG